MDGQDSPHELIISVRLPINKLKRIYEQAAAVFEDRFPARRLGIELRNEDGSTGDFGYIWNTGDYYLGDRNQSEVARLLDLYRTKDNPAKSAEECFEY